MILVYTLRAAADRERIRVYLEAHSSTGARSVMTRLDAAARLLREQPEIGILTDIPHVRVCFIGRYPYKLFYRFREETIVILHIRHTSREPSPIL